MGLMGIKPWMVIGGLAALSSLTYIKLFRSKNAKVEVIYILPDEVLLDIFNQIRKRFSKSYKRFQSQFRKQRRKLQRRSEEYWSAVKEYTVGLPVLLRETIKDVLTDSKLSAKILEDTLKLHKIDPNIQEACEELREIPNKGIVSNDLTPEVLNEILEFIKTTLDQEYNNKQNLSLFEIIILIEDEINERFKYEIEEIERAYDLYLDAFKGFDVIFQTISQCKLIPSIEQCYKIS